MWGSRGSKLQNIVFGAQLSRMLGSKGKGCQVRVSTGLPQPETQHDCGQDERDVIASNALDYSATRKLESEKVEQLQALCRLLHPKFLPPAKRQLQRGDTQRLAIQDGCA